MEIDNNNTNQPCCRCGRENVGDDLTCNDCGYDNTPDDDETPDDDDEENA